MIVAVPGAIAASELSVRLPSRKRDELRPRDRRQRHGRVRVVCVNELGRFSEGQRLEQNGVHDAEHGRVGANPEREGKHRRQREARDGAGTCGCRSERPE